MGSDDCSARMLELARYQIFACLVAVLLCDQHDVGEVPTICMPQMSHLAVHTAALPSSRPPVRACRMKRMSLTDNGRTELTLDMRDLVGLNSKPLCVGNQG